MCSDEIKRLTLTEREFCSRVGISRITAWRLRVRGLLTYIRIGSKILYTERHIQAFLESCEQKAHRKEANLEV